MRLCGTQEEREAELQEVEANAGGHTQPNSTQPSQDSVSGSA